MIQNVYFLIIIVTILLTLIQIYRNKVVRNKRQNIELIKLSRSLSSFIFGIVFLTIGMIWFFMLLNNYFKLYNLIGDDYDRSIFQLFNFKYIENLRLYYYEKNIIKHLYLSIYQSQLYRSLLWITSSFCYSIFNFYIWYQQNTIYESGILISGKLLAWKKIIDYKWDSAYEKRFFEKGNHYDLIIITESETINLNVNFDDKNQVDEILKKYIGGNYG